ncbi:hypothetical protein N0V94_003446 [Neodidymelliopsis sp. IMI 364377]|nr:hypothetical protein N0V94_003446 [Neodidymelliopsis sp. IMI 364377]
MDSQGSPSRSTSLDSGPPITKHDSRHDNTEYDLTRPSDVQDYIATIELGFKPHSVERLAGGTDNHVYRVTGLNDKGQECACIIKHMVEQQQSDGSHSLDPELLDHEAKCLFTLHEPRPCCSVSFNPTSLRVESTHVHPAMPYHYDIETTLLIYEDGGNRTLKDAYSELSAAEIQDVGVQLGRWLANLHMKASSEHLQEHRYNNNTALEVCHYPYANLGVALTEYGHDGELGSVIDKQFGSSIDKDGESLCHGKFWPTNVMIRSGDEGKGPYVATVINWEMGRIGNSATDVGQFAAEAFLLDETQGRKGLRVAFLEAYFATSSIDSGSWETVRVWLTRIAVHFAVHVAFWPTQPAHWTKAEDKQALVDIAVTVLKDIAGDSPNMEAWKVFDGIWYEEAYSHKPLDIAEGIQQAKDDDVAKKRWLRWIRTRRNASKD